MLPDRVEATPRTAITGVVPAQYLQGRCNLGALEALAATSPQGLLACVPCARPFPRHAAAVAPWYGAVPLGLAGTCAAATAPCRSAARTGAREESLEV
jgi:hypothetical protein